MIFVTKNRRMDLRETALRRKSSEFFFLLNNVRVWWIFKKIGLRLERLNHLEKARKEDVQNH